MQSLPIQIQKMKLKIDISTTKFTDFPEVAKMELSIYFGSKPIILLQQGQCTINDRDESPLSIKAKDLAAVEAINSIDWSCDKIFNKCSRQILCIY